MGTRAGPWVCGSRYGTDYFTDAVYKLGQNIGNVSKPLIERGEAEKPSRFFASIVSVSSVVRLSYA
eukprot:518076-Prymnesium_polylepis.1